MMRVGLALDWGCDCKQSAAAVIAMVVRGRGDLHSSVEWGVDVHPGARGVDAFTNGLQHNI